MKIKDIIKYNILIAIFMGAKYLELGDIYELNDGTILGNEETLQYHSSYDWLMPVVEKIESLDFNVKIKSHRQNNKLSHYCIIDHYLKNKSLGCYDDEKKLKAIYKAVVEFIKWYNEQNS